MVTSDIEKSARLMQQIDPLLDARYKLKVAYDAVQKEPPGHPNMHPLRAAMKELEAALENTVGDMARSRREDELLRRYRQSQNRN